MNARSSLSNATKTLKELSSSELGQLSYEKLSALSQFDWHRKPSGYTGAPCPICGVETKNLRALHRAVRFEENLGCSWVKMVTVCFGTDFVVEELR